MRRFDQLLSPISQSTSPLDDAVELSTLRVGADGPSHQPIQQGHTRHRHALTRVVETFIVFFRPGSHYSHCDCLYLAHFPHCFGAHGARIFILTSKTSFRYHLMNLG